MPVALPVATIPTDRASARLRIALTYLWRHRRLPKLAAPTLFTEMVQLRKLHDRDPRLPRMADKQFAKRIVADRLGEDWIVPTLWSGTHLPEAPDWPRPFVVKSRHGCNQTAFVRTGTEDWPAIRTRAHGWLRHAYGGWLDEWLYAGIEAGLVVEPFIGVAGRLPLDYKFYVFGGRVAFVQVHLDRVHAHRWIVLDRSWRSLPVCSMRIDLPPPSALDKMIDAAEMLGQDFDFVRVDFYQPRDTPLFGEMSFYPGSGLDPFDPPALDRVMGKLWLAARSDIGWPGADSKIDGWRPTLPVTANG